MQWSLTTQSNPAINQLSDTAKVVEDIPIKCTLYASIPIEMIQQRPLYLHFYTSHMITLRPKNFEDQLRM